MSTYTLSDLSYISREKLAERLRTDRSGVTVIDVRDSDFIGGHINGCLNVPTSTHDYRMPELVRNLKGQEMVVFHCALSQQRGPASALRYLRERERMSNRGELDASSDARGMRQKVYVLDGGFSRWREIYGEDKDLTEGYLKDLWEDY